ncbi:dye-decolorizing peroxidase precursor [Mycena floridula]|nr:dye-decolorizing peroxidase precursor [Mycena floridula]
MRVSSVHTSLLSLFLTLSLSFDLVSSAKAPLLINPLGLAPLPSVKQATKAAAAVGLDLGNIQGDILIGMMKNKELFFFFQINDVPTFKSHLSMDIHPLVTNVTELLSNDSQPATLVNIAFSQAGLNALGINDQLGDSLFSAGQAAGAADLGDGPGAGTGNWEPAFVAGTIHGVLILASSTTDNINSQLASLQATLGTSITESYRLLGEARPGDQNGHEHFGFKDGISQPMINGFNGVNGVPLFPTQSPGIDAGHILLGETGDGTSRPSWAKDGSFLVFRQLKQLVPEFNNFLVANAPNDMTPELLGARMVGRWKSGAPVFLSPLADDPELGNDPARNNNFNYTSSDPGFVFTSDQEKCPFSAHIRKTNPRADFAIQSPFPNHIMRSGIPYGPEVSLAEAAAGVSDNSVERGLAFVAYQSDISVGFRTLQHVWANNQQFVFGKNISNNPGVGFDPITGANQGAARNVTGLDPNSANGVITLQTDFVISRGGEYFFSPPISALLTPLGA